MAISPTVLAQPAAVVVEPRYSQVMPWVLIAASLALALVTLIIRTELHRDSFVVVQAAAKLEQAASAPTSQHSQQPARRAAKRNNRTKRASRSNAPASASKPATTPAQPATLTVAVKPKSAFAAADSLPAEKKTTTEKPLSDSVFSTMLGIAALLFLLGAFYNRISKVTVAGSTVELLPHAPMAQDAAAVASEIASQVGQQVRDASGAENTVTTEEAAKLAEAGAAAAARVQSQAATLRVAASALPAAVQAKALTVSPDQLQALSSGAPLPDDLLKKLAEQALKDVQKDE
jgi:hypothetical protein